MKQKDVVAAIVLNNEGKFIILKRSSKKEVHKGLWNLPSGEIEKGESLEEAAIREVFEETSLKIEVLAKGETVQIVPPETTLNVNYVLSKTKSNSVKLNEENVEYKWVTPEESTNYKFAINKDKVVTILKNFGLLKYLGSPTIDC